MSDTLLAHIDAGDPTRLRWQHDDATWRSGSYAEFAGALGPRACVLLVDGASVTLLTATLPVNDLRTARQAAPYAIEERLAQAVDDTALALAPLGAGRFAIAAMARATRDTIAHELTACGLQPQLVTPEFCALPHAPQTWTLSVVDELATLRVEQMAGIKARVADLAVLLPLLRREYPDTARVVVHAAVQPADFPLAALHGLELEWRRPLQEADLLRQLAAEPPLALLDVSTTAAVRRRGRRLWSAAAILAGIVAIGYPALLGLHYVTLERAERELTARNETLLRATFPAIRRVVNPRVQAEQALAELRRNAVSTPRFLDLLARVDAVRAHGWPAATRIAQVSFGGGTLEVGIEVAGLDSVESVRSALAAAGLAAETLSAEAADGKVVARLRLMVGS